MHNAVQSSRTHAHAHVRTHTNKHAPFIKTIQQPVHVSVHLNRRIQERGIDVYGLTGEEIVFCTLSTGQINIQSVREIRTACHDAIFAWRAHVCTCMTTHTVQTGAHAKALFT